MGSSLFPSINQPSIFVRMGKAGVSQETPLSAPTPDQVPPLAAVQRVILAVAPPAPVSLFSFPFSSSPFSNPLYFFQLSITATFKLQTVRCIRRATTPVLARILVNLAMEDPIVIVRALFGRFFYLTQTQIFCLPAINYCTNGGTNCSANATCSYTAPGESFCVCLSDYTGNGSYCARNYFYSLKIFLLFFSPLVLTSQKLTTALMGPQHVLLSVDCVSTKALGSITVHVKRDTREQVHVHW